jgi:hypothetical protein
MHRDWQEIRPLPLRRRNARPRLAGDALWSSACSSTDTRHSDKISGCEDRHWREGLDSSVQGMRLEDRLSTIPLIART